MVSVFSNELLVMAAKSSRKSAEEWLPFWMHSMDTAGILKKLIRRWVPVSVLNALKGLEEEETEKLLCFIGLVHDIGKLTPLFQSKLVPLIEGQNDRFGDLSIFVGTQKDYLHSSFSPHPLAGEAILLDAGCPEGIAAVIGSHHGKPLSMSDDPSNNIECYNLNYYRKNKRLWRDICQEWIDFSLRYAGYTSLSDLPVIDMATQFLLSGLLISGDWIASNTYYFPLISVDNLPDFQAYPRRVDEAYRKLQFPNRWMPQAFHLDEDEFMNQFGFLPNAMQKTVLEIVEGSEIPGLLIIEAHMGNGKTEAALAVAEVQASRNGNGGVYFGLPSQATANGLFPRIEKWADEQSWEESHTLELLHGAAFINDIYQSLSENEGNVGEDIPDEGVYVHKWFEGGKTGLLADFAVGTIDQLLMAALKKKHVMLRMLGLVGKVVVIDECHAYDAYMNQYLDRVLNWLGRYNVPVILLSATLPSSRRTDLVKAYIQGKNKKAAKELSLNGKGYPLITWTAGLCVKQKEISTIKTGHNIYISRIKEDKVAEVIREKLNGGGCAGIIVNTVKYAQTLVNLLKNELPEFEILLFHSRFTMADRARIESSILSRIGKSSVQEQRDRFIVIGTQVLEQSLDVDFDLLLTQLAPIDLLLQRIGRLHRHKRIRPLALTKPECLIIESVDAPYDKGTEKIYGTWLLHQTLKIIPKIIKLPEDIPALVEKVYSVDESELNNDEIDLLREYNTHISILSKKANEFCIFPPSDMDTIEGMLDTSISENSDAEAAVRDGDGTIETILMIRKNNGDITWFPWQNVGLELSPEYLPSKEDTLKIIRQKIRLPREFNYKWAQTVSELKNNTLRYLRNWQEAEFLKGELFLLVDEEGQQELAGYKITYSNEKGLFVTKLEEP